MKNYINQIICGDNVEVLRKFPAQCIDLIVTSPPYDNLRDYEGYEFSFNDIANELYRILKQGGVCVWVVGDATINGSETGTSFRQALYFIGLGFNLHDTMFYEKDGPANPESNRYYQVIEYMYVFSKGRPRVVNLIKDKVNYQANVISKSTTQRQRDGRTIPIKDVLIGDKGVRFNIWKYGVGYQKSTQDLEAFKHPAIFPEKLARDHILSWSNENDIVLDPMCGSGTTCKMAYRYKRKFIGIDISEKYCRIARQRMKDEMAQLTLF